MRSELTGGEYRPLEWNAVERGDRPTVPAKPDGWSISLVPTQVERLLRDDTAVAWLRGFRFVFVGGGPSHAALLDQAAAAKVPVVLSYGMTETAAMVAAQGEGDFQRGDRSCGVAMPHASLSVRDDGVVRIKGPSVFHGYYPERRSGDFFATADEGALDGQGRLTIQRRRDWVIISGGEKIDPAEVEEVLLATGEFRDVAVVGVPDAEWGQKLVAAYPEGEAPDLAKVGQVINSHLSAAKRPKAFVAIARWPLSAAGKLSRAELALAVQKPRA
jgi:O-succinylbenzoic acid--CoA ligase